MTDLPDISSDIIAHFRFLHHVAVTGQVDEAAAILLDRFSCDPSDYGQPFQQFVGACDAAQQRGRGRFDASWAITEADRTRAISKGLGAAQHLVTLTRLDDGTITLTTWREAPKAPKAPAPPPPPPPNHSAQFDEKTGERTR